VRNADRDLLGAYGGRGRLALTADFRSAAEQTSDHVSEKLDGLRIRLEHGGARQFDVGPPLADS
jgi:hypothetical protein